MGFFDKIKQTLNRIKEDNRNFGTTTKRINNHATFYGRINRPGKTVTKINPEDDFCVGSYLSIENGKGVIYGTSQDDYVFGAEDIASFKLVGDGQDIKLGQDMLAALVFDIEFVDGKKAKADIIVSKLDKFKATFGL